MSASLQSPPAIHLPAALLSAGYSVRAASARDAAFKRALFETARPDAILLAGWPDEMRRTFLDQQFQFQTLHYARGYPQAFHGIVEAKSEPIGRVILERGAEIWCVVDIALLPAWRGRGLGAALLQSAQTEAAKARVPLALTVDMRNPARRLYERLDFAASGEAEVPNIAMIWRPPN